MLSRSFFRLVVLCALAFALTPASPAHAITRSQIIMRATQWVNASIPYSQTGWATLEGVKVASPSVGWRRDCSGFASMAWGLPMPGASTRTIGSYADAITKDQLMPGDIINAPGRHVVLFGGWADPEHTSYYSYEMSYSSWERTGDGTITRITPYPFWDHTSEYRPYRLKGVHDMVDYNGWIAPIEGPNRYATAVAASKTAFPDGGAPVAVLASGENWPDALGASALAGAAGGPVLLTSARSLPGVVAAELRRLGVSEVIIVGGEAAVTSDVAAMASAAASATVVRIGGENRYETSALIAAESARRRTTEPTETVVYVATGTNFPDALAASAASYAQARPIVLTPPDGLAPVAVAALEALRPDRVVVLGSTAAVSEGVEGQLAGPERTVVRLGGENRYDTALLVAEEARETCGLTYRDLAIAIGTDFPDALAGGAMAGRLGTALVLTRPDVLSPQVASLIAYDPASFGTPRCLGSAVTLQPSVRAAIAIALGAE